MESSDTPPSVPGSNVPASGARTGPPRPFPQGQSPYRQPERPSVPIWPLILASAGGAFVGVVLLGGFMLVAIAGLVQSGALYDLLDFAQYSGYASSPVNLNYNMQTPGVVQQGVPFEIELTLENTDTVPQTLHSLQDYSGLQFIQSDPPWQSLQGSEMIYQMTLQPGQVQTVKLTATTSTLRYQSINIDANLDGMGYQFVEAYGQLQVNPQQPNTSAPSGDTSALP